MYRATPPKDDPRVGRNRPDTVEICHIPRAPFSVGLLSALARAILGGLGFGSAAAIDVLVGAATRTGRVTAGGVAHVLAR